MAPKVNLPDRYTVISTLGSGAVGTVYKAKDEILKREVAIKVIHKDRIAFDDHQILRFQKEAKICGSLCHDSLIKVFDFGINDQREPYLVMELLDGLNLSDYLKQKGQMDASDVVQIGLEIAYAMSYAHNHDVIHRDLKSSNLLFYSDLDGSKKVKVIDFGLVKESKFESKLTSAYSFLGSPMYVSPEQIEGVAVDQRADIYSLGCVLFEALTGHLPFKSDSFVELMLEKKECDGPRPSSVLKENSLPVELDELVGKCLKVKAHDRYSSMEELVCDLEKIKILLEEQSNAPTGNTENSGVYSRIESKKVKVVELFSIAAVLLVVSSLAFSFVIPNKSKPNQIAKDKRDSDIAKVVEKPANRMMGESLKIDRYGLPDVLSLDARIRVTDLGNGFCRAKVSGNLSKEHWAQFKNKKLTRIRIVSSEFNSSNLPYLVNSPLTRIEIINTPISRKILRQLAQIKTLERIVFRSTNLKDEDLRHFAKLNIKEIHLSHCPSVTGKSLKVITELWPGLEIFDITGASIATQEFKELRKLGKLSRLNVVIKDNEQFNVISDLKSIDYLRISRSKLNQQMFAKLGTMKHLRVLRIDYCNDINKYQLDLLKKQLPTCAVTVHVTPGLGAMSFGRYNF